MERREVSIGALLSITTGKMLCEFSQMHEAAEFILGHPIWTHEFADRNLFKKMRGAVLRQHPDLSDVSTDGVKDWKVWIAEQSEKYGETRPIVKGLLQREESPIESLERIAPGKPVIALVR